MPPKSTHQRRARLLRPNLPGRDGRTIRCSLADTRHRNETTRGHSGCVLAHHFSRHDQRESGPIRAEVFRPAIAAGAASVILAHNHRAEIQRERRGSDRHRTFEKGGGTGWNPGIGPRHYLRGWFPLGERGGLVVKKNSGGYSSPPQRRTLRAKRPRLRSGPFSFPMLHEANTSAGSTRVMIDFYFSRPAEVVRLGREEEGGRIGRPPVPKIAATAPPHPDEGKG